MAFEYAKYAMEFLKLDPRYPSAIALLAAALLFLPEGWLMHIGVLAIAT